MERTAWVVILRTCRTSNEDVGVVLSCASTFKRPPDTDASLLSGVGFGFSSASMAQARATAVRSSTTPGRRDSGFVS